MTDYTDLKARLREALDVRLSLNEKIIPVGEAEVKRILAAIEELERDAKRWSGFWEASPIYLREDLVSAKTGELVRGRKRFVIYVDLPDRALLETAIDAALAKEQP